jgi:hypothetical protein
MKSKNYNLGFLAAAILAVSLTSLPITSQESSRPVGGQREGQIFVSSVLTPEATTFIKIRF